MTAPVASSAPRAFLSYSWEGPAHQAWVLQLATRLRADGVDVVLDQWDTQLGSDLSLFMERAGDEAYRIIAIVTSSYVDKADKAVGGVGYERKMITPSLMKDLHGQRVVPVLRNNAEGSLPRFLGAAKYIDFRDDSSSHNAYFALLQDLHGIHASPKPPLGASPFDGRPDRDVELAVRDDPAAYVMPAGAGVVSFDHTNNDGRFVVGAGESSFTLAFSEAGPGAVHIYSDPVDIQSVAIAPGVRSPDEIVDPSAYDASSRARLLRVGDAAVVRNCNEYWAVVIPQDIQTRDNSPGGGARLRFRYAISPTPRPTRFGPQ